MNNGTVKIDICISAVQDYCNLTCQYVILLTRDSNIYIMGNQFNNIQNMNIITCILLPLLIKPDIPVQILKIGDMTSYTL